MTSRLAIFRRAAETARFVDEHGLDDEAKRRIEELERHLARFHDRSTLVGYARHFICEKNLDAFFLSALEAADGTSDLESLMSDAVQLTHRIQQFDGETMRELHDDVFSFAALFELSSRGKGVEIFMPTSDPQPNLRRQADPFALYIFDAAL